MGKTPRKKNTYVQRNQFLLYFHLVGAICICDCMHLYYVLCMSTIYYYYMQCAVSALQPLCYSICSTKYTLVFTRPLVERTNGKDMCLRLWNASVVGCPIPILMFTFFVNLLLSTFIIPPSRSFCLSWRNCDASSNIESAYNLFICTYLLRTFHLCSTFNFIDYYVF